MVRRKRFKLELPKKNVPEMSRHPIIKEVTTRGAFDNCKFNTHYISGKENKPILEFVEAVEKFKKDVNVKLYYKYVSSMTNTIIWSQEKSETAGIIVYLKKILIDYFVYRIFNMTVENCKDEVKYINEQVEDLIDRELFIDEDDVEFGTKRKNSRNIIKYEDIAIALFFNINKIKRIVGVIGEYGTHVAFPSLEDSGVENAIIKFYLNKQKTDNKFYLENLVNIYDSCASIKTVENFTFLIVENIGKLTVHELIDFMLLIRTPPLRFPKQELNYFLRVVEKKMTDVLTNELINEKNKNTEFNLNEKVYYQHIVVFCIGIFYKTKHKLYKKTNLLLKKFFKDILRDLDIYSEKLHQIGNLEELKEILHYLISLRYLYTEKLPNEYDLKDIKFKMSKLIFETMGKLPEVIDLWLIQYMIQTLVDTEKKADKKMFFSLMTSGGLLPEYFYWIMADKNIQNSFSDDPTEEQTKSVEEIKEICFGEYKKYTGKKSLDFPKLDINNILDYFSYIKKTYQLKYFIIYDEQKNKDLIGDALKKGLNFNLLYEGFKLEGGNINKNITYFLQLCVSYAACYGHLEDNPKHELDKRKIIVLMSKFYSQTYPNIASSEEKAERYITNIFLCFNYHKEAPFNCYKRLYSLISCFYGDKSLVIVKLVEKLVGFFSKMKYEDIPKTELNFDEILEPKKLIEDTEMSNEDKYIYSTIFLLIGCKKIGSMNNTEKIDAVELIDKDRDFDYFYTLIETLNYHNIKHPNLLEALDILNAKISYEQMILRPERIFDFPEFSRGDFIKALFSTKEFVKYFKESFNVYKEDFEKAYCLYSYHRDYFGVDSETNDKFSELMADHVPQFKFKVARLGKMSQNKRILYIQRATICTRKSLSKLEKVDFTDVKSNHYLFLKMFFKDKRFRALVAENKQSNELFMELYKEYEKTKERFYKKYHKLYVKNKRNTLSNSKKKMFYNIDGFKKNISNFLYKGSKDVQYNSGCPGYNRILEFIFVDCY